MICDDLFKESELYEEDVDEIDRKIKSGIVEKLRWSNDAHFKKQNAARVLTTKDILPLLGI